MASFEPKKINISGINGGQKFTARDGVTANAVNAPIEAALLMQKLVENSIDVSEISEAGLPAITIVETDDGPHFKFSNFASLTGVTLNEVLSRIAAHNEDTGAHPFLLSKILNAKDTPIENSTALITAGGVYNALLSKQDNLVFDAHPKMNSTNPVTSNGIRMEIDAVADSIIKYVNEQLSNYDPDSTTGETEATPNTIAKRDTYGSLYGKNKTEYNDPTEIDAYVGADELITRNTLKKYAIPNPNASENNLSGVYIRDVVRGTVLLALDYETISVSSDVIPTSQAVNNYINALVKYISETFETIENVESYLRDKQDTLIPGVNLSQQVAAFDLNPVTSGAVQSAIDAVNDNMSLILERYATKEYADSLALAIAVLEQKHDGQIESAFNLISNKQDKLTFDTAPTKDSQNPVTSGGLYTVIGDVSSALTELHNYAEALKGGET